jgi:NAD(P)-dependent dehydrogenase (short-subunit alcohol dehydrogenase family)
MKRLSGKSAIVTGGAVGIGRACVRRMAEEGAKVAIFDVLETEGKALADALTAEGHEVSFWRSRLPSTRPPLGSAGCM